MNTAEQYEQVIRAFTDRTNDIVEREPHHRDGFSEHELIDLAERFALLTRNSFTNVMDGKDSKSKLNFSGDLIFAFVEKGEQDCKYRDTTK